MNNRAAATAVAVCRHCCNAVGLLAQQEPREVSALELSVQNSKNQKCHPSWSPGQKRRRGKTVRFFRFVGPNFSITREPFQWQWRISLFKPVSRSCCSQPPSLKFAKLIHTWTPTFSLRVLTISASPSSPRITHSTSSCFGLPIPSPLTSNPCRAAVPPTNSSRNTTAESHERCLCSRQLCPE